MALERSVLDPIQAAAKNLNDALEQLCLALDEETEEILHTELNNPVVERMFEFLNGRKSLQYSGLESLARNFKNEIDRICRERTK